MCNIQKCNTLATIVKFHVYHIVLQAIANILFLYLYLLHDLTVWFMQSGVYAELFSLAFFILEAKVLEWIGL